MRATQVSPLQIARIMLQSTQNGFDAIALPLVFFVSLRLILLFEYVICQESELLTLR